MGSADNKIEAAMSNEQIAAEIVKALNRARPGHMMGACAGNRCPDWVAEQVAEIATALASADKAATERTWEKAIDVVSTASTRDAAILALEAAAKRENG